MNYDQGYFGQTIWIGFLGLLIPHPIYMYNI